MFSIYRALTHRSFPRILPDSSNFPGASKILFKVWRKNELSSVKCLSPRSFKFFSLLFQPFYSSWFRSASIIHGGVSHHHYQHLKTKEEFSSKSYQFSQRFVILVWCHPLINSFRLREFFSPIRSNSWVFSVCFSRAHHLRIIHSSLQLSFSKSYRCIAQVFSSQFMSSSFHLYQIPSSIFIRSLILTGDSSLYFVHFQSLQWFVQDFSSLVIILIH